MSGGMLFLSFWVDLVFWAILYKFLTYSSLNSSKSISTTMWTNYERKETPQHSKNRYYFNQSEIEQLSGMYSKMRTRLSNKVDSAKNFSMTSHLKLKPKATPKHIPAINLKSFSKVQERWRSSLSLSRRSELNDPAKYSSKTHQRKNSLANLYTTLPPLEKK